MSLKTESEEKKYWEGQRAQWEKSGLSQRAFCKQERLSYRKFTYNLHKIRNTSDIPVLRFIEAKPMVRVEENKKALSCAMRLLLPNGVQVVLEEVDIDLGLSKVVKAAGSILC